jgi:tRNA A-37 threonylcarbamoyl transferase component Bud32
MATEKQSALTTTGPSSYVRVAEIAAGGMGRVEVALRSEGAFRRLYAVKRLHANLVSDLSVREMFMEEARIAGLIRHPNVVSVLDVGEDAEGPFLIMDYVEGASLSAMLKRALASDSSIPIQVCVRLAREIALGLHAAHELVDHDGARLDVVHRDLSPQNVLVGFDGSIRITDFGIAKALGRSVRTSTGVLKGKLSYMSPEQLQFEEPDRRSDLFSLGVILFELLAGRRLYDNSTHADAPRRILKEPPPDIGEERPEVPAPLVALLFALLAKDRDRRPSDAMSVASQLGSVLASLVSSEGAFELSAWIDGFAGELRRDRKAALAAAIAQAEATPTPVRKARSWRAAAIFTGAAALVLSIAIAVGYAAPWADPSPPSAASASSRIEPREEAPPAEEATTEVEPAEQEPIARAEDPPAEETGGGLDEGEDEASMTEPRNRRRRARGDRRRAAMAAMTVAMESAMTRPSEDGWDDWNSP